MLIAMRIITALIIFVIIIGGYYLLINDILEQMEKLKKINISSQEKKHIIWLAFKSEFVFQFLFKAETKEDRYNLLKGLISGKLKENKLVNLTTVKNVAFAVASMCVCAFNYNIQENGNNNNLNSNRILKSSTWKNTGLTISDKEEEKQYEF